jgi:hypothetical protein
MRLTTQIHRFTISATMFALFAGALALQPRIDGALIDADLANKEALPSTIIVVKTPGAGGGSAWRQMLPASFAPRRS